MLAAAVMALAPGAQAAVTFRVTFDDPDGALQTWQSSIESNVLGGATLWSAKLLGETELWIEVRPSTQTPSVQCRSFTWSYLETLEGAIDIFETGSSVHVRNGFPASSFDPDIVLEINPAFAGELWFDPAPLARTQAVDPARVDAVSLFARGLGNAFAFDGWMNEIDGTFPGTSRSVFDRLIDFDGTNFAFTGSHATEEYRGPVPMTFGDPFRLGNQAPRPGTDLFNDLMGGAPLTPGARNWVSAIDVAILRDSRVPILLPCPCDLTGDGLVDDADFLVFSDSYNVFDCGDPAMPAGCPGDFNLDAAVDDSDYVLFVISYERLLCP